MKYSLVVFFCFIAFAMSGQSSGEQWGVEFSVGKRSYNGDLGNGFFNYRVPFYGMGALRGVYALRPKVDLAAGLTLGRTGYERDSTGQFVSKVFAVTTEARYYPLRLPARAIPLSPYLSVGLGLQRYAPADTLGARAINLAIPIGIGLEYELSQGLVVFGQMRFGYNFGDRYDGVDNGQGQDHFLTSEVGLRYRFSIFRDADGDGVPDDQDRCPRIRGVRRNHGCPDIKKSAKRVFEEAVQAIHFEVDKAVLLPESYPILDRIAKVMKSNPYIKLTISGHTDSDGSAAHNLDLSRRRARSVKTYLVSKGIAEDRMKTAGYGEAVPIADNRTDAGKSLNRRVEFEIRY